ncbi:hypothetical protein ACO0LC_12405 [Undibacterium sp. JH2W]|uniref:hypothetical protein n=1 Tax=Undibacterium sp. JH2W TaxID=3413037 RepID=UPI003BF092BE
MNFKVLFEGVISNAESLRFILTWSIVVGLGGFAILFLHAHQQKWSLKKTGWIAGTLNAIIAVVILFAWRDGRRLQELKELGTLPTVEGPVSQFRQAGNGQKFDSFCVIDTCFQISEFDSNNGYKVLASKGGVIHEGQYVRLTYDKGVIFKIEEAQ